MTYTKSDVDFHSDGFRPSNPAVNVKVYGSIWDVSLPLELGSSYPVGHPELTETSYTEPLFTHEWIEENASGETLEAYFHFACEQGWEQLQTIAEDVFGSHVEVFSEGRSSGWAVVHGLSDFEEWDAIALGQWRRFELQAEAVADDIPYQTVWMIYANVFEPWHETELARYPLQSQTRAVA